MHTNAGKYDSTTDEDIKHKKSPSAASADSNVDSVASMTDHHDVNIL